MDLLKRTIGYCILALQVFLVFVLAFESRIEVPPWLQAAGRVHPLLLHLPIGMLLVAALLIFTRRFFDGVAFPELISFLLYLTALTASVSALMGIFLSREGGYAEAPLGFHKWLGVSLSFICWAMLGIKTRIALKVSVAVAVILLVLTGHFGASLTHGENFVLGPLETDEVRLRVVTDSTTVFSAGIEPILENKCYSCHNEQKAKGKLVLTSPEHLMKGGKSGALWTPGDPGRSLLMERIALPLENKKHMPPRDKAQLTADELLFIAAWIEHGASTDVELRHLASSDTLKILASPVIARYEQPAAVSKYAFEFVPRETIQELNTPYRNVFQIAGNEPALQVDFFLSGSFQIKFLEELLPVRSQVVSINLSKMPVDDAGLRLIGEFTNLEKLILNNTEITGPGLKYLAQLGNLRSVSLSGTSVDADGLRALASNGAIDEVFIWNTGADAEEVAVLQKESPKIAWELGYQPDENEILRLSPPFLKNEDQVIADDGSIELRHRLPGTIIRYSIGGEDPDSLSSDIYESALSPGSYTVLKTKAYKEGWLGSNVREYIFFRKGHKPARTELESRPDPQYPGEGALTLTDEKKGMPDFYRDPAWMAFRDNPLEATFFFEGIEPPTITHVTLSYARNIYAMCMPPASFEVWAGDSPKKLKLLGRTVPGQPGGWVPTRIEGATVEIPPSALACYRIVATPLAKLPDFRDAKKEKGWLMVDEVFFN